MKKTAPIKKKMATGGFANWANKNQEGITSGLGYAATAVDAFAPTDNYGVRNNGAALGSGALSGAATGAALGSAVPIVGTAIGAGLGAIVGGVSGLLGNKAANAKKTQAIDASTKAQLSSMEAGAEARIAGDPSLKYGRMSASYYANGGKLTPPRRTAIIPKVQPSQRVMPNVGTAPARQMSKYAKGGEIEPLSTNDVKINGASHAAGGVKIPTMGVELEGGETVNDGFVFSKKLGFAKPAEKIARALGKAEQRPENPINTATVNALQRKTELLKVQQEAAKKAAGIPNDMPTMADGGPISGPGNPPKLPVITNDPKDPRIKAYSDSLNLYNKGNRLAANNKGDFLPKDLKARAELFKSVSTDPNPTHYPGSIKPAKMVPNKVNVGTPLTPIYKKPTTPVVYQPIVAESTNTGGKDSNKPLSPSNPLMVEKKDGSIGQWGNDIPTIPTMKPNAMPVSTIPLSDKAKGLANYYYPGNSNARNPTPAVIKSPTGKYKFGGTMKKMANGGVDEDLPGVTVKAKGKPFAGAYTTDISTAPYKTIDPVTGLSALPQMTAAGVRPLDASIGVPAVTAPVAKPGIGDQIAGGFEKAAPFLSNFYNATQKLPLPPVPQLNDEITPNLVDYSASRAEAVRATRGADKIARENLNSGAAVSATKAANLSQQVRSVGQINEAENNANTGIRNQTAAQNAQIKAGNTAMQNNYQNELVARDLKGKQLASANMADIEQKIQGMHRDKKIDDNEHTKLLLTIAGDDTGALWRGGRNIISKYLTPEELAVGDANAAKLAKRHEADAAEAKANGAVQRKYMEYQMSKGATKDEAGMSTKYTLGENPPSVIGKPEKETKTYDKNGKLTRRTVKD